MSHTTEKAENSYALDGKKIWIAGHRGMVGSALLRRLQSENCQIITAPREQLDLTQQTQVESWMQNTKPHAIIIAAAKVGGIQANSQYPADFLYQNLMIETNIIHTAYKVGTEKLLFLGSSCIYPKYAPQPIQENALLTAPLEPTNEPYAIAKIAGIKLCQSYRRQYKCDFISAMPCNLYGPGDNYHLETSHVIPALLRKAHNAKLSNAPALSIWGSGKPLREFLHVDDLADGLVHVLKNYSDSEHINIGSGEEISIAELTALICRIVQYNGNLIYDQSRPDGTPRKLMDISRIRKLGWKPSITLEKGLSSTYRWLSNQRDWDIA